MEILNQFLANRGPEWIMAFTLPLMTAYLFLSGMEND